MVLTAAVWLQAQDAGKASSATTLQGCLQYTKGHYFLTDGGGTAHQLSGEANKLKGHVGHTVELMGKPGIRTVDTTIQGAASSAAEQPVFKVTGVKHVADSCKAGM
jgi:hypothetical protein